MNYFIQPEIQKGVYELNQDESMHCIRVLRKKQDDLIHVLDGNGTLFVCKITEANPKKTRFEILEEKQKIKRDHFIHIAIAPTKNMERLEWFIEKSVEIGIDQITFLQCQRSERKNLKLDRLQKKAIVALKQSGNLFLPGMSELIPFEDFIHSEFGNIQKYIAHAGSGISQPLMKTAGAGEHFVVLIGPEGDFSPDELQASLTAGFIPVTLGPSRLRTETAGLVACLILNLIHV